ncbi:MAG: TlpA disulfide reductase family protein [Myxococcota bacterium]
MNAPVPPAALSATDRVLTRREEARPRDRAAGVILVLCLLAAVGLAGRRVWEIASGTPPPVAGQPAPLFTAPLLEGGSFDLEGARGKVLLIDFWATWCPPCVASLPHLERIHGDFADRDFAVIGVNQEPGDEARVRAFVAGKGLSFPTVMDAGEVGARYGVTSLPTTYLVDREGRVRAVFRGLVSAARLERAIEEVLGEG